MEITYTVNKTFQKEDVKPDTTLRGEYENCVFTDCLFSKADLAKCRFINCHFSGCDLSLAKLTKTSFQDCIFNGCKMLGLSFDQCDRFNLTLTFTQCNLSNSTFYGLRLPGISFTDCNLSETDFTEADLTKAVFENCDLSGAIFDNTTLESADLRTSVNFNISPVHNRIRKTRFSLTGLPGLLTQWDLDISAS